MADLEQELADEREKFDFREEQLRPWLYNEVKEHLPVDYNEPLPTLIKKFQQHVELPAAEVDQADDILTESKQPEEPPSMLQEAPVASLGPGTPELSSEEPMPAVPMPLELEGEDSPAYHNYLLTKGEQTPLKACIGDAATDEITKKWLEAALLSLRWRPPRQGHKVLELMAGYGRNYSVLKERFRHVEMLDGSEEMMKRNEHEVTKHRKYIQDFKWPVDEYDCIVGVWCLCYLQGVHLKNALAGMLTSVKERGYLVLMEPVLATDALVEESPFMEHGQGMMVRKRSWYERRFEDMHIEVLDAVYYEKAADLATDVCVFVLRDSI